MSRSPEDKPDGKVYTGSGVAPPRPGSTKLWPRVSATIRIIRPGDQILIRDEVRDKDRLFRG